MLPGQPASRHTSEPPKPHRLVRRRGLESLSVGFVRRGLESLTHGRHRLAQARGV
jgi:hypothetical protein